MRMPLKSSPLLIAFGIATVLHLTLLPVAAGVLGGWGSRVSGPTLGVALAPPTQVLIQGGGLEIEVTLTNDGMSDAEGLGFTVWLSTDRKLDDQDLKLIKHHIDADLAAGASRVLPISAKLPDDAHGPVFLIAQFDADHAKPAVDRQPAWIDSKASPRVRVDAIDAPAVVFAGGTLSVGYTLRNAGQGWARGGWADTVVLSRDDSVSDDDVLLQRIVQPRPLGPHETRSTLPVELRLPLAMLPGDFHIIVSSDAPGSEPMAMPLRVEAASHPDLALRNVELSGVAPGTLAIGKPATLKFDVLNRSPRPTPDVLWGDRVYLSADQSVSDDDAMLLSEPRLAYPGMLPGGGRYRSGPHSIVVTPEQALSSQMFLIVVTDDENDLNEGEYEHNNTQVLPITLIEPQEQALPDELELGRDDEPQRTTVAWIAYDDFQDVLARESVTLQPMLQDQADPVPGAPLERDPDNAASANRSATNSPPTPEVGPSATPPSETVAAKTRNPLDLERDGELADARPEAQDQPGDAERDRQGVPDVATADQAARPAAVNPPSEGDKPTSAPRSDRESDPTTLIGHNAVRPGQVLVGPGLEVKTFRAKIPVAARVSAIPRNPLAELRFDTDGTVVNARLVSSSGYDSIDGPLLSSLYRWKATGKRLESLDEPFSIRITILLNPSLLPESEDSDDEP